MRNTAHNAGAGRRGWSRRRVFNWMAWMDDPRLRQRRPTRASRGLGRGEITRSTAHIRQAGTGRLYARTHALRCLAIAAARPGRPGRPRGPRCAMDDRRWTGLRAAGCLLPAAAAVFCALLLLLRAAALPQPQHRLPEFSSIPGHYFPRRGDEVCYCCAPNNNKSTALCEERSSRPGTSVFRLPSTP